MKGEWQRVSKSRPCPVCEHSDWCTFQGPADNPEAACCMRVESDKRLKNGGWLHRLRDGDDWQPTRRRTVRVAAEAPDEKPIIDFGAFARQCHLACTPGALGQLAGSLGLSAESLRRLRVGWSRRHNAWTFPMSDAAGNVTGIRLRLPSGKKLSVRGGHEGLFLPTDLAGGGRLLVCEGPTDTAALLDLGLAAVGRPSCTGGTKHLVGLVQRLQPAEVAIVADNDAPGLRGANDLASVLVAYVPEVRIITPPSGIKDARQWKAAGATAADISAAIEAAPVRRLSVTTRRKAGGRNGR